MSLVVILGAVLGTVGFIAFVCLASKVYAVLDERKRRIQREQWKASHTSALRGNFVKHYSESVENHYYLDNDQELGKGGCGVVVIGQKKDNGEYYAIKIINKNNTERGRIDREMKLMKDVDHANIVRLFSIYEESTHFYFVMELCTGGHLGALISRQPKKQLDEEWTKVLCRQLLSAVAHIHSRGIAHRDIKLQNILMDHSNDRTAQVKLIDFGYGSRYIGALPMRTKCGTPYTTAPEVLRECYDERCDVWSVGVVLYIMLSGKRPFEALDIPGHLAEAGKAAMITNILACRYHFNHSSFSTVSKEAKQFVQTLLHPDYKTRISAQDALESPWLQSVAVGDKDLVRLSKTYKSSRAISNMKLTSESTTLRQTGNIALVFGMQPKAATEMRSVFQTFDSDGSGALSESEFHKAMTILAPELNEEDIKRLFHIIDIDSSGSISYTEFLAATLDPREIDVHELNEAFKLMDDDGNGYITIDELRKVLNVKSEQKSQLEEAPINGFNMEKRILEMMHTCDVDNDGVISYDEFLWAMTGAGRLFGQMPSNFAHGTGGSANNTKATPSIESVGFIQELQGRQSSGNNLTSDASNLSNGNINLPGSSSGKCKLKRDNSIKKPRENGQVHGSININNNMEGTRVENNTSIVGASSLSNTTAAPTTTTTNEGGTNPRRPSRPLSLPVDTSILGGSMTMERGSPHPSPRGGLAFYDVESQLQCHTVPRDDEDDEDDLDHDRVVDIAISVPGLGPTPQVSSSAMSISTGNVNNNNNCSSSAFGGTLASIKNRLHGRQVHVMKVAVCCDNCDENENCVHVNRSGKSSNNIATNLNNSNDSTHDTDSDTRSSGDGTTLWQQQQQHNNDSLEAISEHSRDELILIRSGVNGIKDGQSTSLCFASMERSEAEMTPSKLSGGMSGKHSQFKFLGSLSPGDQQSSTKVSIGGSYAMNSQNNSASNNIITNNNNNNYNNNSNSDNSYSENRRMMTTSSDSIRGKIERLLSFGKMKTDTEDNFETGSKAVMIKSTECNADDTRRGLRSFEGTPSPPSTNEGIVTN